MTKLSLTGHRDRASSRGRRRSFILPLAAAVALFISAACGSSDDDTSAPEPEVTDADSEVGDSGETDPTDSDEEDDTDAGDDGDSIADCPLGTWALDNDGLKDWYAQLSAGTEGLEVTDVSGSATVTFTADAIVYEAVAVSATYDFSVQTVTFMLDGTVSHTWTDQGDGAISMEVESNDMTATMTAADGSVMDGSDLVDIEGLTGFSRYTCNDDSVTLEQQADSLVVTSTWQAAPGE